MSRFKKGDRVHVVEQHGSLAAKKFFGHSGVVVDFDEYHVKLDIETDNTTGGFHLSEVETELERPRNETELERLVRVANEGFAAEDKLRENYSNSIEWDNGEPLVNGPPFTVRLRIKPKPAFEPFYVGPEVQVALGPNHGKFEKLWKVELKGDPAKPGELRLHVGCKEFWAKHVKDCLVSLCVNKSSAPGYGIDLRATRDGVMLIESSYTISWQDADRILEALEKVGV